MHALYVFPSHDSLLCMRMLGEGPETAFLVVTEPTADDY